MLGLSEDRIIYLDIEALLSLSMSSFASRRKDVRAFLTSYFEKFEQLKIVDVEKFIYSSWVRNILYFHSGMGDGIRYASADRLAEEIRVREISGEVAELGVFKGVFAAFLRQIFPDKKLYLFDTFEGFMPSQGEYDKNEFDTYLGDFSNTSVDYALNTIGDVSNCIVKKGCFPDTAKDIEEAFCFVSLDVDLYQPTLDGLEYFYPRLSKNGFIMVHDYNSTNYRGCRQAILEFCGRYNICIVPIVDNLGTAILTK